MKSIYQEIDVLLGILLVIYAELLLDLSKNVLELLWHHHLVGIPHLLDKMGKVHYQFTLVAHSIFNIHLIFISLVSDIVLVKLPDVDEALHGSVHVAGVS